MINIHSYFTDFLESPEQQRRLIRTINRDYEENRYCRFSSNKIKASIESISSSCSDKPTRDINQLGQTFGASTLEHEFILQPKDDEKAKPQNDLWRTWDAFYRFCRLYSVIGTVSTGDQYLAYSEFCSVRSSDNCFNDYRGNRLLA